MTANRSPEGARFTFWGTVLQGIEDEKRIKIDDRERSRLEEFWKQEGIDTKIDYDPESKLYHVALRNKAFIARCRDGDTVDYTLETVDRDTEHGIRRGIRCVDLQVRLTAEQRAELARRDAELDASPGIALTWEQIRASIEAKP